MTPTAPRSTSTAWSGTASTRPAAPAPAARSTRTPATGTEALAVLRYVALAARPEWLIWRPTLPASGTDSARRGHRELEAVGDVAGPAAARVGGGGGGDADELHPRPAQEHGQGAGVVGVAPKIGVEMDPHLTTTPSVTPYSPRYPTFAALARRA